MHIGAVPNRGSHPTILLRQSYREGKRVRKRTLANLTSLPPEAIEAIKRTLRGEKLVSCDQAFAIERSIPHGHVKAVLGTIRKIGLDTIIASRRSRQRDPVAKAEPSASVQRKKTQRTTSDGLVVHSLHTLLEELGTLCRNRCRIQADPWGNTFTQDTQPTQLHARVFRLLGV